MIQPFIDPFRLDLNNRTWVFLLLAELRIPDYRIVK